MKHSGLTMTFLVILSTHLVSVLWSCAGPKSRHGTPTTALNRTRVLAVLAGHSLDCSSFHTVFKRPDDVLVSRIQEVQHDTFTPLGFHARRKLCPAKRVQHLFTQRDHRLEKNLSLRNVGPCRPFSVVHVNPVHEFGSILHTPSQRNMAISRIETVRVLSRLPESTRCAFRSMHRRLTQPSSLTVSLAWISAARLPRLPAMLDWTGRRLISVHPLQPKSKMYAAKRATTSS